MKRFTGPGKFEERADKTTPTERLLTFSLFNFDIEDATLKPEHKSFLEFGLLDFLTFKKGVFVSLRGEASRTGNSGFNQKLSQERVNNVRDFLLDNGIAFAKIDAGSIQTSAAGDRDARAAGEAKGTEDERFRAVLVTLHLPTLNLRPHFEDVFRSKDFGFDNSLLFQPPSVLVRPEEGFREVKAVTGAGLSLKTTIPGIIRVVDPRTRRLVTRITADPQVLRLETIGRFGETELQMRDGLGNILARLRVMVLPKLTVPIAFHYVLNPDANSGVSTRRKIGREQVFIGDMDLTTLNEKRLTVVQGETDEFETVAKQGNPAARVNVFFVREVEKDAEGTLSDGKPTDTIDGIAKLGGIDCIIDDDTEDSDGEVIAHEAGHCLGVDHDNPIPTTRDMLMSPILEADFIPRVHALLMRRGVTRRTA